MTSRRLTPNSFGFALALVTVLACSPLARVSPTPTEVARPTSSAAATVASTSNPAAATGAPPSTSAPPATSAPPSITATIAPTDSPPAAANHIEFVRWLSQRVGLATQPGGAVTDGGTGDEPIAAVLERRVIDGMEWIRVQVGRGYAQDFVMHGWSPYAADIHEDGKTVHVEPVYEFIEPDCPTSAPTIADLDSMLPLQSVHCLGHQTLTFSPIQVREEGSEEAYEVDGTPDWMIEGGNLVAYWLPERWESGSIRLYVDPKSRVDVPLNEWLAISGHLDDPAAQACTRTSERPEFQVANQQEAAQICRGKFVVTGVRPLGEAEIPPFPALPTALPLGGPVHVDVRVTAAPAAKRGEPTSVWTGSKLVIWGGWSTDVHDPPLHKDGDTYDPANGTWASIPDAPVAGRYGAVGMWTGSELLVWGGNTTEEKRLSDGAAYDPVSDSWRVIADAPLEWNDEATSAWTGTEWWIAVGGRDGATNVAAYDPAGDGWRSMPSIPDEWADTPQIVWTGSKILLLTAAGLFEMGPTETDWTDLGITDVNGPTVWAGGMLIGMGTVPTSEHPLDFGYLSLLVGWDPITNEQVALPPPPRSVYEPVLLQDRYLTFFQSGLAFDVATGRWLELAVSDKGRSALDTEFGSEAWAGDRLLVWGGNKPCSDTPANTKDVFELIPDWSAADGVATRPDAHGDEGAIRAYAC